MTDASVVLAPFLVLPVDGASISVMTAAGSHSTVAVSDAAAGRLEQLQFDLGEGPHWWTLGTGVPVLLSDVAVADHSRWPAFGEAVQNADVAAVFSFPLRMGATTVGVVDLHAQDPVALSARECTSAASLADAAVPRALMMAADEALRTDPVGGERYAGTRREVHQATGMLSFRLGIPMGEAFARLRGYAFVAGRSVDEVAEDIVARRLDLAEE